ncbi:MAG: serine/threonine protein kinase [Planctomycetaceae bacterium]|nr:serine/threonine protein kinase [Planctomycetaceae bacterium]
MTDSDPTDQQRFAVLEDYVEQLQQGLEPDRAAVLRQYPELASALECVEALENLVPLAAPPQPGSDHPHSLFAGEGYGEIGDFVLLAELGRGGMGVVYKARQKSLDRLVAIKIIQGSHLASPEQVRRFGIEAKAAAQVQHPHVVSIYEAGRFNGQPYLAMTYVEGVDLATLVATGRLDMDAAVRLVMTVARAVEHMHRHGIVHRDLKPSNILVDADGKPYITDFGLAKLVDADGDQTATGLIAGTPSYMAPEQAAGKADRVGPATDVYALGAILYTLLTGRPPFRADSPLDTIVQVLEREPVHPRAIDRRISRTLELICLKCLEKNPARRYASAGALADDLERYATGEPVAAQSPRLHERIWRWARRAPALASHLAVLGAFLTVEFVNYYGLHVVDAQFNYAMLTIASIWIVACCVLQGLLHLPRWSNAARFAWGGLDVILYTLVMRLADGAASPLVVGYPMLIVGAGLWFRVRLVWFVTLLSLASYLALVIEFYLQPTESQQDFDRAYDRPVFFVITMLALGAVVAYQIARVRALSRYYEARLLP